MNEQISDLRLNIGKMKMDIHAMNLKMNDIVGVLRGEDDEIQEIVLRSDVPGEGERKSTQKKGGLGKRRKKGRSKKKRKSKKRTKRRR
jgi:hypothetical protein